MVFFALSFGGGYALATRIHPSLGRGLDSVEQAWSIIFHYYVDKDRLGASALSQAAIKGMLEALDDLYTSYLDAKTYQLALSSLEGKFEDIGAHLGIKDGQLIIIAPIADSPAAEAGIRAGDIILEVNGELALDMSLTKAVLSICGPEGTPVSLLILHQGETEPGEINIIGAEIELPSIRFEMMGDIAYTNIAYFSERTTNEELPRYYKV